MVAQETLIQRATRIMIEHNIGFTEAKKAARSSLRLEQMIKDKKEKRDERS